MLGACGRYGFKVEQIIHIQQTKAHVQRQILCRRNVLSSFCCAAFIGVMSKGVGPSLV